MVFNYLAAVLFLLLQFCSSNTHAQNRLHLQYSFFKEESETEFLLPAERIITDSAHVASQINARLITLYENGYLAAHYKIRTVRDSLINVNFITGEIYTAARIAPGNLPDEVIGKTRFNRFQFENKPFSYKQIVTIIETALDYGENHGYPFVAVRLDSIQMAGNSISATFRYQSGPQAVFDSLIIEGSEKMKPGYLMVYLGLYKGKLYEEALFKAINKKITLLPYVKLIADPELIITDGKCTVKLSMEDKRVNSIDAIIGFLPNQQDDGKPLITGQVDLDLQNLFGSGKQVLFNWQRFNVESQMLKAAYRHPNLLRTPINFAMKLDLLKQDTSFLNRSFDMELSMLSPKGSYIGFQTKFYNSSLISTTGFNNPEALQANADNKINTYGLRYHLTRFDDVVLPRSGWGVEAFFSVGQKKIVKNPALDDVFYSNLELNSIQYTVQGNVENYSRIVKSLVLRSQFSGGYIQAGQLFDSDKYRLGGLTTIRGFAEQSIFVTGFGALSLELRAMLGEESYVMTFIDQALTNDATAPDMTNYLFGTGAGISLKTDAGRFNFVLALGKSDIQPFAFNYSKIHFGYISRF